MTVHRLELPLEEVKQRYTEKFSVRKEISVENADTLINYVNVAKPGNVSRFVQKN